MINKQKLREVLTEYKQDFDQRWKSEKFKWEAIKQFQDNWDPEAENFGQMLDAALLNADKLLKALAYFPIGMITGFANKVPEETRKMFTNLFDESQDLAQRITNFREKLKKFDRTTLQMLITISKMNTQFQLICGCGTLTSTMFISTARPRRLPNC